MSFPLIRGTEGDGLIYNIVFIGAFACPFGSSFFPTDVGTKKMNPAIMNKKMGA
jgi:hypothetical protein